MTKSARPYTLIAFLVAAVIGGIFTVTGDDTANDPKLNLSAAGERSNNLITRPRTNDDTQKIQTPAVNVTQKLGQTLGRAIGQPLAATGTSATEDALKAELLQSGPDLIAKLTTDLEQSLNGPDSPFFVLVTDDDIVINPTDTEKTQRAYLVHLASLVGQHFNNSRNPIVAIGALINGGNIEGFAEETQRTAALLGDLYDAPVPPSWKAFHKELLIILEQQSMVFSLTSNFDDDPAGAILAIQKELEILGKANELNQRAIEALRAFDIIIQTAG